MLIATLSACSQNANNKESRLISDNDSIFDFETQDSIPKTIRLSDFDIDTLPKGNYDSIKIVIAAQRKKYHQKFLNPKNESQKDSLILVAGKYIENTLTNKIIPFWYGTEWEFSGHTNTPVKGQIACGYFVSTTLKHCGFNLNRYKLAQQNPEDEAQTIQLADPIHIHSDSADIFDFCKSQLTDALYFVGFDCHVGYLLKRKSRLFFIHSNYMKPYQVDIEVASESEAFVSSQYFISGISRNKALIEKWILSKKIEVKTQ